MSAPAHANGSSRAVRPAEASSFWRKLSGHRTALWRIASIGLFFLAWEIAGRIPISFAFPTFLETLRAFVTMTLDGSFVAAYAETLQPLVIGIAISAVIGVGLGIVMGLSRFAEWLIAPVFIVLQAAPMAALIPLITFMYGIGLVSKTLAVIMLALPVIALNGYKAVRNANPSLVAMCYSFQGTWWQRIVKIIIPDASPVIFAGLRLGLAAGFIGVILAELLITPTGIGDLITYHRSVANYAEMYAAVVSIILVSTLTLAALEAFELRVLRPEKRKS
ncbi:binding-protein-dependent transport systems inner membrane component [Ancylobacter novellus DSM 506]|uniref:Binding-protein-dependent transport systems inner membrane component n=1 Tax=Ancylobacter novellus (strain ATCC 8093 / DSM 506 / JCM 20403 / CCM 1077 / IAM 12100 / NBRC 12443 / NCIMB 10456) TaxID=639283 RepID=D7A1I8_ANCN5|nr:ABC transporter permease [Ancylobacter novellus]ADH91413.1 binding-protein-dependent transport systems inner membrane component [Ancylobacter novellus DSM 506]